MSMGTGIAWFLIRRVCEKDIYAGQTIDHETLATQTLAEQVKLAKLLSSAVGPEAPKRRKLTKPPPEWATDPFKLVQPCRLSPPFSVSATTSSMLLMDFHSHLAHTEVIGLLGGSWDAKTNSLAIKAVYPCRSTSTEVQCEMDPESEMEARKAFADKGMVVVGWYHSHPTFVTYPSIRDIENQAAYQELFREKEGEGFVEPFVGYEKGV
jgi:proteasome lid subunit RPN8/RPN11